MENENDIPSVLTEKDKIIERLRRENDSLFRRGIYDQLTMVYNRQGLDYYTSDLLRRASQSGKNLFYMICDIDNLKNINDSYGHANGDKAIRHAANVLACVFKSGEVVARTGGDEFVVCAAYTYEKEEICWTEKAIQREVNLVNERERLPFKLSISYGYYYGELVGGNENFNYYTTIADERLYERKMKNHSGEVEYFDKNFTQPYFRFMSSAFNEFFIVNISKDVYTYGLSHDPVDERIDVSTYTSMIAKYAEKYIAKEERAFFEEKMGKKFISEQYKEGKRQFEFVARRKVYGGEYHKCRYVYGLSRSAMGDIMSFLFMRDVEFMYGDCPLNEYYSDGKNHSDAMRNFACEGNEGGGYMVVCDDFEVDRVILTEIFKNEYSILQAENGSEAIDLINAYKNKIKCLLLDVYMPVTDGFAVLDYMANKGWLQSIPVVMITAADKVEISRRALRSGACDCVYKPFDSEIIYRRVKTIIDLFRLKK